MAKARAEISLSPYRPITKKRAPLWARPVILIIGTFLYMADVAKLLYRSISSVLWEGRRGRRLSRHILFQQVYFTAVQALPLTGFVALGISVLLMSQASIVLPRYGVPDHAEWLTVNFLFKEIGPVTVALIIIARSANAIVIEIGNMKVNGELRALEVLGINIDRYVLLPRIVGMVISVVTLTIFFCAIALWGGFGLAEAAGMLESNFLLDSLVEHFTQLTLFNVLLRAFCFGLIIGSVACLHGLRVGVSPTEVPQQASRGVVRSLSLCFVINFVIAIYLPTEGQQ